MIDAYGPVLLHIVAQDIQPNQVCSMLGMCKSGCPMEENKEQVEMIDLAPATVKKTKASDQVEVDADPKCILCEFVINLLEKKLKNNETEPELEKLLQNVCNKMMPANLKQECNQFVQQYGQVIISLLMNQVEPEKVCRFINLCQAHKETQPQPEVYNPMRDEEHLFKIRSREMAKLRKEEKILEKAPKELKKNELFDEFSTDPEKVDGKQTIQCSLCIYVAELVDKSLDQNKTEEQIVSEVLKVCHLFPSDLKDQCTAFINEYGPYVIKLIAADIEPLEACTALKLCTKSKSVETLRSLSVKLRDFSLP